MPSRKPDRASQGGAFADNADYLRAELNWVRRLAAGAIRAGDDGQAVDEFAGLCISRAEIDRDLERADRPPARTGQPPDPAIERERGQIDARIAISLAAGVDLRLPRTARALGLDGQARSALLCAAAAELDPAIARMFAFLHDDATRRRPTFALLAGLLAHGDADPLIPWRLFGADSPLQAWRLFDSGGASADTPIGQREARLASGVVAYLLGLDALPPALAAFAEVQAVPRESPANGDADSAYYRHHRAIADELIGVRAGAARLPLCYIAGPAGAGQRRIAAALARSLGRDLLLVRWGGMTTFAAGPEEAAHVVGREACMRGCVVVVEDFDTSDVDADRSGAPALAALAGALLPRAPAGASAGCDLLVTGRAAAAEFRHRTGLRALGFDLPYPTAAERFELWQRALPATAAADAVDELPLLAQKFKFTPGQIASALAAAELASGAGLPPLGAAELNRHCRAEAHRGLYRYCQPIVPRFEWNDIVLPADTQAQLREVCHCVRQRARVFDAWGYGAKVAVGRGIAVLFSGASGTGKTMSAEVIAADLGLDLFRVDLSRIVSKYIGETEKNLARIFDDSAVSNCVLFFDEADALFGKRTEVKDAHDRYANIEVNYLLSEMDRCEGVVIVSTNLKGNLDPAFIRRFTHVIEYPLPNEKLREAIWTRAFPLLAPRSADVDFAFLAQRFNLSGGNIKNIALASAFLAAGDGGDVSMAHVIRATKREYQKIGRICSKSDFGPYYGLVREAEGA